MCNLLSEVYIPRPVVLKVHQTDISSVIYSQTTWSMQPRNCFGDEVDTKNLIDAYTLRPIKSSEDELGSYSSLKVSSSVLGSSTVVQYHAQSNIIFKVN